MLPLEAKKEEHSSREEFWFYIPIIERINRMCSTELFFSDDEIAVLSKIPEMAKKIKEGNSEKIRDRQPLIGAFEKFMTFIQSSYEEDGSEGNQNFLIDKMISGNCMGIAFLCLEKNL